MGNGVSEQFIRINADEGDRRDRLIASEEFKSAITFHRGKGLYVAHLSLYTFMLCQLELSGSSSTVVLQHPPPKNILHAAHNPL
jgi:hypothetical protein